MATLSPTNSTRDVPGGFEDLIDVSTGGAFAAATGAIGAGGGVAATSTAASAATLIGASSRGWGSRKRPCRTGSSIR